jgi:hypothetical protein
MYNQFVNAFIDMQTESARLYREMEKQERSIFGINAPWRAVRGPSNAEITQELRRLYETMMSYIIDRARSQFANGGGRLVLSRTSVCKLANIDIDKAIAVGIVPDFDRVWLTLEARFGQVGGGDR